MAFGVSLLRPPTLSILLAYPSLSDNVGKLYLSRRHQKVIKCTTRETIHWHRLQFKIHRNWLCLRLLTQLWGLASLFPQDQTTLPTWKDLGILRNTKQWDWIVYKRDHGYGSLI